MYCSNWFTDTLKIKTKNPQGLPDTHKIKTKNPQGLKLQYLVFL